MVRPVIRSVKRIGSKSTCDVRGGLFSHSGLAQAPLKVTRSVCTSDWNMARPSACPAMGRPIPIDGSPELRPSVFGPASGGVKFSYLGAGPAATGAGSGGRPAAITLAVPLYWSACVAAK